jgi:hypothetical protein
MYAAYGDHADFFVIYIREAHPTDGWQVPGNLKERVEYEQPQTYAARKNVASACVTNLNLTISTLVDSMDNAAERIYNAWPERLYVLSAEGRVVYQGARGPYGFDPDELECFLKDYLAGSGEKE